MKFSQDGMFLATSGQDTTVKVWKVKIRTGEDNGRGRHSPPMPEGARKSSSTGRRVL